MTPRFSARRLDVAAARRQPDQEALPHLPFEERGGEEEGGRRGKEMQRQCAEGQTQSDVSGEGAAGAAARNDGRGRCAVGAPGWRRRRGPRRTQALRRTRLRVSSTQQSCGMYLGTKALSNLMAVRKF